MGVQLPANKPNLGETPQLIVPQPCQNPLCAKSASTTAITEEPKDDRPIINAFPDRGVLFCPPLKLQRQLSQTGTEFHPSVEPDSPTAPKEWKLFSKRLSKAHVGTGQGPAPGVPITRGYWPPQLL